MGFRITTWNVNGIRNPFSYEPWRGTKTFESMFDILESDIVVFQETKIQRKDLKDDMVLVPGELPEERQIGGYPTMEQLTTSALPAEGESSDQENEDENAKTQVPERLDATILDSEGRTVLLEFPAFVLIGVYCPAYRDESRDCFRMDFLNALDARIRNLVAMGKRVFLTGDINIAREPIDAAHAMEGLRKGTTTEEDFVSRPSRKLFNELMSSGTVIGERTEGREQPVLHDICRSFHPGRAGMYTCWDTRLNTRPGNYGSRIDYVLSSLEMQDWFSDSNIQEGLMGSDHCPVYAVFKDQVPHGGDLVHIYDIMNPPGMFKNGQRQQEYSSRYMLPASGRLLPEFDVDKRRSIKDMFTRKPPSTLSRSSSTASTQGNPPGTSNSGAETLGSIGAPDSQSAPPEGQDLKDMSRKRSQPAPVLPVKRSKSVAPTNAPTTGQKTLKGFFKPKTLDGADGSQPQSIAPFSSQVLRKQESVHEIHSSSSTKDVSTSSPGGSPRVSKRTNDPDENDRTDDNVIDPIVSKEDWTKLFTKKPVPRCDSHQEPCISLTTKKPGINRGRSFWICPRPLGPSGEKEKGTQWRCPTFIWASDWNGTASSES
ncbi:Endonuclease/exonuclease/phosphatase [Penicillium capsulatum]|uniref:DNA-(apurinic or apyrimidinic site) endonuclease n=1 Tax=Penicillium capsulatum TaxID=69766 RepID=A0A9W9LLL0_9EURO|nr:Endonuclease/exonuclease/phosphatase [Penicillium capsulatum]KAJ6117589.1 Endonuclease/exonuclease/phosphatase [Penicillium capsulatum]